MGSSGCLVWAAWGGKYLCGRLWSGIRCCLEGEGGGAVFRECILEISRVFGKAGQA